MKGRRVDMSSTETIVKREQGENVIYKNSGICRIAEIKAMSFAPGEEKMYYVLEPVYSQGSRTYVPTDSVELNACMRSLLDQKQIDDVIIQSQAQITHSFNEKYLLNSCYASLKTAIKTDQEGKKNADKGKQ